MSDKKKMAMLIIGKKEEPSEDKKPEYKEEDMHQEALEYCAMSLMKSISHEDTEKFLKSFKKLLHLIEDMKEDDKLLYK
jgi:hypothetical protein